MDEQPAVTRVRGPKTLIGRVLSGSVLSALVAGAALGLLLVSLLELRRSTDQEAHSKDTVAAAAETIPSSATTATTP